MMAKEKFGIRQFDFRSHGYCKYLCESSDGCYFIIPVVNRLCVYLIVKMRLLSIS